MKYVFIFGFIGIVLFFGSWVFVENTFNQDSSFEQSGAIQQGDIDQSSFDITNKDLVVSLIIHALQKKDLLSLERVVSQKGITFSPYSFLDTKTCITFQRVQLYDVLTSSSEYVWGFEDGTGDPIILSFDHYFKKYIYDVDYLQLAEKYDFLVQRGNMINNLDQVYSGASFVEFFVPGLDPQYEGFDWKSLILVLEKESEAWKLRALVHNQWTI